MTSSLAINGVTGLRLFDLDDVSIEMKDNSIVGHILSGNEPHRCRGSLGRRRVGEWSFGSHFNQRGLEYIECCGKGCCRSGAIARLLHEARRSHDLILVAGFALLNAGGQDLLGGHVGDRHARAADVLDRGPSSHLPRRERGWSLAWDRSGEGLRGEPLSNRDREARNWDKRMQQRSDIELQAAESFHFRARFDVFEERDEASDFAVACREDHALRFDPH